MSWYAAHLIMYVKLKERPQSKFTVWENIVLIQAASEEEAWNKAEERGRADEGDDDGTLRWGGKPATWVFEGIRKLTACHSEQKRPGDGTEISFTEMQVESEQALHKLAEGLPVTVKYNDRFRA
jgi:hypothetical protein